MSAVEESAALPRREPAGLRIVLVSQFALPKICGIAAIVDQLGRALVARGHEVTHVASSWGRRGAGTENVPYRLVTIPAWNPLEPSLGVPYPMFSPRLWGMLRDLIDSADVFHTHGFLSQTSTAGLFLARRRGTVGVLTEHVAHVPYENPVLNLLESAAIATVGRYTSRLADAIVTYNSKVESSLRELAPGVPIAHIENGVNFTRYRPPVSGERERLRRELGWDERPRALFVGRLVDKKGAPIAIEAARGANGAFQLVLVGPGAAPPPHPDVLFLGATSQDRVAEIYRASDVFVLPSIGEGFPLSVQEALASGLPVVVADDPAYRSVLRDAGDAVRAVPRDAVAVRDAVMHQLRVGPRAGEQALRFAKSRFSWDVAADQHLALYARLLGDRS